jgi:hypothetical protein
VQEGRVPVRALSRACLALAVLGIVSCAEGYEGLSGLRQSQVIPSGSGGTGAQIDAGPSKAGSTGMTMPQQPPTGAECAPPGQTEACTCASTGTVGVHACKSDIRSSKGGYFAAECTRCAPPTTEDPGDITTDAGPAGSGGMGGRSGSGGLGGAASASGSGGSAGSTGLAGSGSAGRPGTCTPACTNSCFPVGILACCRPVGGCGCTWAPGAYCF